MRKSRFGIGAGFMLALAGLVGSAQAAQPLTASQSQHEQKATQARYAEKQARTVHSAGGLDLKQYGEYGMSPMQYGMLYGNGASRKGRTNLLACSHRAKVNRRAA